MRRCDVVVVGAGVVGCAVARELSGRGLGVLLVERGRPGREASGAAAGLLSTQAVHEERTPLFDLGRASAAMFPALAGELKEETGIDVEFRACGSLRMPCGEAELQRMRSLASWQQAAGLPAEWVEPARRDELAGLPLRDDRPALHFREEAVVDNRRLVSALARSAARRGAGILLGEAARSLRVSGGRCEGARTDREEISAGWVVNCAGAWADFAPEGGAAPVFPVRGQIVEIAEPSAPLALPVHRGDFYAVPRADGRVLLGSTVEPGVWERSVGAEVAGRLLSEAVRLMPALAPSRLSDAWAGLRPGTPDGLPLIGAARFPNYLMAAGHYRAGILLAPVTARIVAALVAGETPPGDIAPYRPSRFAKTVPS